MTATAIERQFATFRRGVIRDEILRSFRVGLRQLTNPDTNLAFTELEVATSTARLSRWYIEADALDLVLLTVQQRDLYFTDQARVDRAATSFLTGYHGLMWGEFKLSAVGGSGPIDAPAVPGTIFVGSATVPDAAAVFGTDPAGLRYQVLFTATATAGGLSDGTTDGAQLQVQGIDTGPDTNLDVAAEILWSNGPPGAPEPATVITKFSGGVGIETDAEFARRLLDRIRKKQAAGNNAQFRAWGREANAAVEDAFIYATALQAGSVRVAIMQKRGNVQGPLGRIPSIGTLTDVTGYLTPPASPVVPVPPLVVVTGVVGESVDTTLGLALPFGQSNGWDDLDPWPGLGTSAPVYTDILSLSSQTSFKITRGTGSIDLPTGVTAPSLMAWNALTSRWEALQVTSAGLDSGDVFDVVLSVAPAFTLVAGTRISPDTDQRDLIAETTEDYFDGLGPGELVDLTTDSRAHRAYRAPRPNEDFPQRAGSALLSRLRDSLGAALADSTQDEISLTLPTVPSDPVDEPNLLVAGDVAIYAI